MFGLVKKSNLIKLQKEYDKFQLQLDNCRKIEAQNKVLQDKIYQLELEIKTIKEKLREQIEADLFFISAKIQKKLLDGKPKENVQDLRLQQIAYQNQLAQMQQQTYPNPLYQALGSLGNIFGR